MLPAKRQAIILEYLRDEQFAAWQDLARVANASLSTVRRDVELLCDRGHLRRTRGGAALRQNERLAVETGPEIAPELARDQKQRIARHTVAEIEPRQALLLDSGSTTLAIAHALLERRIALTVFTNDLMIAATLARSADIEVHVPPGQVRCGSSTLLGSACYRTMTGLRVDIAWIGAHAVCRDGASETSTEHGEIKRVMLHAADQRILVVDSGKFGGRSRALFAPLTDFDRIVTDDQLSNETRDDLCQHGATIETAV